MELCYPETDFKVELFDFVELQIDGDKFNGIVKAIHPKSGEVSVTYANWRNPQKQGAARRTSARVPLTSIELQRRDG